MEVFREWVERRKAWYSQYGIDSERLRFNELSESERPHYAKAGIDVEYLFPWGWGELESIAHRGTYDLDAHVKLSGKDLQYFDEATKTHYTPLLIESSAGIDRTVLTFMIDAYERERGVDPNGKETERTVLRFHPMLAPVQARGLLPGAQQAGAGRTRAGDRDGAAPQLSDAIRRRKYRPALSAPRRDRNAVLRYGRLRDARRRQRHGARARHDAARARRCRRAGSVFGGEVETMTAQAAAEDEIRLFLRRGRDATRSDGAELDA